MKIEYIILKGLLYHDDFTQRVLPFIKKEYFPEQKYKIVFGFISEFIEKYKGLPTYEAILIDIGASNISEVDLKDSVALLEELHKSKSEDTDIDWLIDQTEKWIQNRAIYIAIMESVNILDGKNNNKGRGEIPQLLSDAISVSIHNNVGHDYLLNAEDRYDVLHRKEKLVSTGIDILDRVLGGGFPPASLSLFMSNVTGGGKTLTKCHLAASALLQGKNVLYITLEMAEPQIANRIDANLLNIELNTLKTVSKQDFIKKFDNFRNKIVGNLIIKQYPTGSANILHFRSLLHELKLKRGFVPDIVFVDYLNLCASSRIKLGGSTNSYGFMKAVAEEIRGLGMEFDVPFVSSTQSNRIGINSTDVDLSNISDSVAISYTVDFQCAIITSDQLDELGQLMFKQLKNRWNSLDYYRKFCVGVDRAKMKLFNLEESAQLNISGAGNTNITKINTIDNTQKNKFDGFKF